MILLGIFGAGLLGLLIYGVVYKVIFVQGRIFEALVLLALIAVAACGVVAAILSLPKRRKSYIALRLLS